MKKVFLVLFLFFFGSFMGWSQPAQVKNNWNFAIDGSIGMGRASYDGYSSLTTWHQMGLQTQFMPVPFFGFESGVYYGAVAPKSSNIGDAFNFIEDTYLVGIQSEYVDIPLNVIYKPNYYNRPNRKATFTLQGGLNVNIPTIEKGQKKVETSSFFSFFSPTNTKTTELQTGNPKEIRLYVNISPGMEFKIGERSAGFIKLKAVFDPEITVNTSDFQYDFFLGLNLGLIVL